MLVYTGTVPESPLLSPMSLRNAQTEGKWMRTHNQGVWTRSKVSPEPVVLESGVYSVWTSVFS